MPAYHLRTFYLARQSTWGTPATPNFRLEGVTDGSVTVNINDKVIDTIGWNVGNITMRQLRDSEVTISLVATYEQILYIMHALFGAVTPTGSSPSYVWIYTVPKNNVVDPQLYTIRYGIEDNVYQLHSCILTEITFKGEVNGALELELTFVSPNEPTQSTVPSINSFPVNAIHVREAEFYLSNIDTFPVTTFGPIDATLISFEINVNPNRHIKRFVGNSAWYGDGQWQIDGSLTVEFNTTSKAIINNALANVTQRNLRLNFVSPEPNKVFSIIMPFTVTDSIELFSDRDGNATVELKLAAVYASVISSALRVDVLSDTDTLL